MTAAPPQRTIMTKVGQLAGSAARRAMTDKVVNLYEAKTQLSALVERAAAGETIVIAKAGRPLAQLVPISRTRRVRLGSLRGRIVVPDDFDRLAQEEIESMFEGD